MRFEKGADVFTADGRKVGRIGRVVVDPRTSEVTHLVVEKGFLLTTDKVVPASAVEETTGERVTLQAGAGYPEDLPDFEEDHYVPIKDVVEEPAKAQEEEGYSPSLYWYPPAGATWWGPTAYGPFAGLYPIPPYVVETERHIPEDTVALREGAEVIGHQGDHIGNVEAVVTEPKGNRVTHLVVSRGLLLTENKLVPVTWVASVSEESVRLLVGSDFLKRLPEYDPSA